MTETSFITVLGVLFLLTLIILMITLIRIMKPLKKNLEQSEKILIDVDKVVKDIEFELPETLNATNELLNNSNILIKDIQEKSKKIDPLFDLSKEVGQQSEGVVREIFAKDAFLKTSIDNLNNLVTPQLKEKKKDDGLIGGIKASIKMAGLLKRIMKK